ncbi:hypothetical protein [Andreprevotia sp. IGB-42]|uniref:hypothetical protein n=1 Tax=Andreprevotia sp. IGB-42 TaxID=2497473 RepID=UPI00135C1C4B|nr:hypothetical protein [Andreprevotia sp. IGB-42]
MTDFDLGQLLYYRKLDGPRQRKVQRLIELCEAFPQHAGLTNLQYAIGRALPHSPQVRMTLFISKRPCVQSC